MDSKLQLLAADYQAAVARRFTQLRTELGFDAPKSNTEWACSGLEQRGRLSDGAKYFKHGYGCAIKGTSDYVDFDFGANGRLMVLMLRGFGVLRLAQRRTTASPPKRRSTLRSRKQPLKGRCAIPVTCCIIRMKKPANQSSEPTSMSVTICAEPQIAPATLVAHL